MEKENTLRNKPAATQPGKDKWEKPGTTLKEIGHPPDHTGKVYYPTEILNNYGPPAS